MRFHRATEQRRRRGAPLWRYLTALVLLPLVGVVVLATAAAQARADEAASAERAEGAMRTLTLLDTARTGVEQELIPLLALRVMADPSIATSLGIPEELIATQAEGAAAGAERTQRVTDRALARLSAGSIAAAAADRAAADLDELRNGNQDGELEIESVYYRFLTVSTDLMAAQEEVAAAAMAEGVPGATMRAIRDVQTVATLSQLASRQLPLFLGSLFVPSEDGLLGSRAAWQTTWLDYSDTRQQLDRLS